MLSALFGCRERKKRKRNDREYDGLAMPKLTMITSASVALADLHPSLAAAAAVATQFTTSIRTFPTTIFFTATKL